jgi:hypothetical protein
MEALSPESTCPQISMAAGTPLAWTCGGSIQSCSLSIGDVPRRKQSIAVNSFLRD